MAKTAFLHETRVLIAKELRSEWRSKYALSGILLYVVSTVYVAYLSFQSLSDTDAWNALFWIIQLFAATTAVSKSFLQQEQARWIYLYTLASPQAIITSKILYHGLLVLVIAFLSWGIYSLFLGNPVVNMGWFALALALGSVGFSGVLTLISALAAQTENNIALTGILSFPLLLPLLLALIRLSRQAIAGMPWEVTGKYVLTLAALNVIVFILAYVLFPYLWRD